MPRQLAQVGMAQVHVEGAGRGTTAARGALGCFQAALVVDNRHARAAEAGEEAHERRDGAETAAPFAQEYQLNDKHGRHEQKRPVQVARAEQAHQQGHRCESEAHGAHEANTGNPNTAVVSSAPPSTAWRESKGALRLAWQAPQAAQS